VPSSRGRGWCCSAAARIPRTPSPRHLLPRTAHPPPTTLRTADRSGVRARTREQEGPSCSAMPTAPPADPRRRVRLRARVCYAREDGECSRVRPSDVCARWVRRSAPAALARGPLELDPPAFLAWALSLLGAWGRPACARYAPTSLSCARTARLAGGTSSGTSVGGFACLCGTRLFALWLCTLSLAVAVCL